MSGPFQEIFVETENASILSRFRRLWELIKETANPNTMHTEDLTEEQRRKLASYESFDYQKAYPEMYMTYLREQEGGVPFSYYRHSSETDVSLPPLHSDASLPAPQAASTFSSVEKRERKNLIIRWVLHVVIAVVVSLMAAVIAYAVDGMERFRFHSLSILVNAMHFRIVAQLVGYLFWLMSAAFLVLIGTAVVVFIEPTAGGGGIPTVMAYLNGVYIRRAMSIKTFFVKAISCTFAVASGLPVGIEAPLVHLGAIVGAGVTQGGSKTLGIYTGFFRPFRNHQDRRAFITAGAACGVSAAFGAPIGGLLFVMEEISSYWDHSGSGQVFLASMIAMTTTTMINSLVEEGNLFSWVSNTASVLFEVNISIPFNLKSIVPAVLLGLILGALAALFTKMTIILNKWRNKHLSPFVALRVLEPVVVIAVYATLAYFLSWASDCRSITPIPEMGETIAQWGTESQIRLFADTCKNQTASYSPLGTLNMATGKNAIRHLFTRQTAGQFPVPHLLLYFLLYTCFACISSGMSIASGLVVPSLVIGAAFGRLYGLTLWHLLAIKIPSVEHGYRAEDAWLDPGLFALIGSAAFLAGTSRLGMSVCVIVVELSSELRYLLPIMVGIVASKAVANWLSEPLYHHLLHLDCVPFLSPQIPSADFEQLTAADVMVSNVVCLRRVEKTVNIWRALETTHHAFPVMEEEEEEDDDEEESDAQEDEGGTIGNTERNDMEKEKRTASRKGKKKAIGTALDAPESLNYHHHFYHHDPSPRYRGASDSAVHFSPSSYATPSHAPFPTRPRTSLSPRATKRKHRRFVGLVTRENLQAFLLLPSLHMASAPPFVPPSHGEKTPLPAVLAAAPIVHAGARFSPNAASMLEGSSFTPANASPSSYWVPSFPSGTAAHATPSPPPSESSSSPLARSSPHGMTYRDWIRHKQNVFSGGGVGRQWWAYWATFLPGRGTEPSLSTATPVDTPGSTGVGGKPAFAASWYHSGVDPRGNARRSPTAAGGGGGGGGEFPSRPRPPPSSAVSESSEEANEASGFLSRNTANAQERRYCDGVEDTERGGRGEDRNRPAEEKLLIDLAKVMPETVDLSMIINRSPWVIPLFFNLFMAYKTFSMMGLRHMVVVDGEAVCGIITRKDLLPDALRLRLKELRCRLLSGGPPLGLDTRHSGGSGRGGHGGAVRSAEDDEEEDLEDDVEDDPSRIDSGRCGPPPEAFPLGPTMVDGRRHTAPTVSYPVVSHTTTAEGHRAAPGSGPELDSFTDGDTTQGGPNHPSFTSTISNTSPHLLSSQPLPPRSFPSPSLSSLSSLGSLTSLARTTRMKSFSPLSSPERGNLEKASAGEVQSSSAVAVPHRLPHPTASVSGKDATTPSVGSTRRPSIRCSGTLHDRERVEDMKEGSPPQSPFVSAMQGRGDIMREGLRNTVVASAESSLPSYPLNTPLSLRDLDQLFDTSSNSLS